jgi:ferric-dicitrate binding protein FerR (iron transport regulator)
MRRSAKHERLLRQAAIWFDRMQGEHVSPRDVRSWERWMTRSAEHRRAFLAVEHVCRIVDRLRESRLRPH